MSKETVFEVKSWDEEAAQDIAEGIKIVRAKVSQSYRGRIEGEGRVEYLMYYKGDGTAIFLGYERIIGSVDGRQGSVLLQHQGIFEGGAAISQWTVVGGSATDDLQGLSGTGSFNAGHKQARVTLDIAFE